MIGNSTNCSASTAKFQTPMQWFRVPSQHAGVPSAPTLNSHVQNYKLSFTHVQDMLVKSQH